MATQDDAPRPTLRTTPEEMRGRWALCAAMTAAQGWPDHCNARENTWHYDDGGGNWADLRIVSDSRAVLVGHDHEYSETYFRDAASYFGEPETDLLAGLPAWCIQSIDDYSAAVGSGEWLGFVYAFESGEWLRAEYSAADGFANLKLPTVGDDETVSHLSEFLDGIAGDQGSDQTVDVDAVRAAVALGADVDAAALRAMFGKRDVDIDAGVSAARAFRR